MELLVDRYGANVDMVLYFYTEGLAEAADANLDPLVYAMLRYGIEAEAVCKPVDFFIRRTGALYFDIDWVRAHKCAVNDYMAIVFQWTNEQQERYMNELDVLLQEAVIPTSVSELSK